MCTSYWFRTAQELIALLPSYIDMNDMGKGCISSSCTVAESPEKSLVPEDIVCLFTLLSVDFVCRIRLSRHHVQRVHWMTPNVGEKWNDVDVLGIQDMRISSRNSRLKSVKRWRGGSTSRPSYLTFLRRENDLLAWANALFLSGQPVLVIAIPSFCSYELLPMIQIICGGVSGLRGSISGWDRCTVMSI